MKFVPGEAYETSILKVHLKDAVRQFESTGFTPPQAAAIARHPRLAAPYAGDRIDQFIKTSAGADWRLQHVSITPRFTRGPDFFHPPTRTWWDATTAGDWAGHVRKYTGQFGTGVPLLYKLPSSPSPLGRYVLQSAFFGAMGVEHQD
jgi:hypothetical protein